MDDRDPTIHNDVFSEIGQKIYEKDRQIYCFIEDINSMMKLLLEYEKRLIVISEQIEETTILEQELNKSILHSQLNKRHNSHVESFLYSYFKSNNQSIVSIKHRISLTQDKLQRLHGDKNKLLMEISKTSQRINRFHKEIHDIENDL